LRIATKSATERPSVVCEFAVRQLRRHLSVIKADLGSIHKLTWDAFQVGTDVTRIQVRDHGRRQQTGLACGSRFPHQYWREASRKEWRPKGENR
ncbi:MAG TPA: hypothetical protein VHC90_01280, partial [Bryobacteraceae bacterium]|nr:hypothetical protein [Bryobacteraceae bacterium]